MVMVYHVSNRFLKKTFMTASWLLIFVSAEPSPTILLTDRSEPRFKSHTGCKIKTLKNENLNVFC